MISVIIPVYNCEKFINRCVESVLKQSYKEFELILVNDGSTDSSGEICEELKSHDDRIHVIHKVNGGVSSARNAGLNIAQGEYIAFIDADDWVDSNYLSALIKPMLFDNDLDIVIMPSVDEPLSAMLVLEKIESNYVEKKDAMLALFKQEIDGIWAVWSKLYRKRLFLELRFNESLCYGEDLVINIDLFFKSIKIYYLPIQAYHYFHGNLESINQNSTNIDKWIEFLKALAQKIDYMQIDGEGCLRESYCLLILRFYRLTIELIIFYENNYVAKLQYLYDSIGNLLPMIFDIIPQTHLTKLENKLQGSYEDCLSMINAIYSNSGDCLYIYGTGKKGSRIASVFAEKGIQFRAYIISDGYNIKKSHNTRHPVLYLSEFLSSVNPADVSIYLALKGEFAEEVLQMLDVYKFKNIFYL